MEVLFTFLSDRDVQRSVCLSTNLLFSDWERIFKNPLTTVDVSSDDRLDKRSDFFGCPRNSSLTRGTQDS
jgi:hypothetical protein